MTKKYRELSFGTTNEDKIAEAKVILGLKINPIALEVDEIQSLDPIVVATNKARIYFEEFKRAIFIEDVSLRFNALGNLPGTYIDDFSNELKNDGLIALLDGKSDKSAVAQTTIVFIDEKGKEHVFVGEIKGEIAEKVKGDKGFGWDPIFIPTGQNKTFGEMELEEKNKYSMRAIALGEFKKWLDK